MREIFEKVGKSVDEVGFQFVSKSEVVNINESLKTKLITKPKLLIKDRKNSNTNG